MGWFDLPSYWVYVYFDGGVHENVANTDTLSKEEAQWYHDHWSRARNRNVYKVTLEDSHGNILRHFHFEEDES